MATGHRLAVQWIVLGNNRLADGTYAVLSSADPKNLLADSQDETIAGSLHTKSGSKNFPLQTIEEVISHGNLAARISLDLSSMSAPTLLSGHQHAGNRWNIKFSQIPRRVPSSIFMNLQ